MPRRGVEGTAMDIGPEERVEKLQWCVCVCVSEGVLERNHNGGRPHQKGIDKTAMKGGPTGRWLKKLQLRKTDRNHNKRGPGFIDDKNHNGGARKVIGRNRLQEGLMVKKSVRFE